MERSPLLQKITIITNHWKVPSPERVLDGWLEGRPTEEELNRARKEALEARAVWKPSEEGMRLVEQLKAFIGTRVKIQFWDSIMLMLEDEGPYPLEGVCRDVLLSQQGEFLQAYIALDNVKEIRTTDGYSSLGYLVTLGNIPGQLAPLSAIYEVGPVKEPT